MGISGLALILATTNEPKGDTVRDFQAALRARYDATDWLDVVKPINDEMRGLQRDALVAYILHQMRADARRPQHIDTPDKLFEYFLMDVQMEPCMQTSRIRHALSSVQLFIERCLMNLEPRVAPSSSIEARKQWEWMKRYRVWEANRKVFLWPENWLEPELRDDQSPFFKEAMSELLQSDITEDSAATALLNYLVEARRGGEAGAVRHPLRRGRYRDSRRHRPRGRPHRRRQPQVLLPPPRRRLVDAVGADQARYRGQPGHPGGVEGPPVPVLAEDSRSRHRSIQPPSRCPGHDGR